MHTAPSVVVVTTGVLNLVQLSEPKRMALISYSVSDSSPLMRYLVQLQLASYHVLATAAEKKQKERENS